ncbi:hypothetical protein A2U01_0073735, partial [Trifolium medium]|nr:hypothetical protein [Trifolium medium]
MFDLPRTWSKIVPPLEEKKKSLKRKAVESSHSDFDVDTNVATFAGTSRRSIGRKKVPLSVPPASLDNISFHLENGSVRW